LLSIDFDTSSTARAGGVHIIMTFMPEDDSENKQIEGRTCRQDDPGSARKILFALDHIQTLTHTYTHTHTHTHTGHAAG
jgi:preprotein translocase subunit SecA